MSLGNTAELIDRSNNRLASGLKVASPIDDAKIFFEAKALTDRAGSLNEKKDGIDQGISSLSTALEAVEAVDSLVRQAKGIVISAKSTSTTAEAVALEAQFDVIRTQIDQLAADASFQGLNLVNGTGSALAVSFSERTASNISIASVDLRVVTVTGLAIAAAADFSAATSTDTVITALDTAITTLRSSGQSLGSNVALLQTRLDFTEQYVNVLDDGAGKLTLADITEEGANLVALQTRQQLGINGLSFAGQSEQNILALFR